MGKREDLTVKLQLGCGHRPFSREDGWLNHDITFHSPHVDMAFDLTDTPWPIDEKKLQFSEICAMDVFEHIPVEKGIAFFDECWRLLEDNGVLHLRVPEFGSYYHLGDLTHVRGFMLHSFDLLDPTTHTGRNNFYTQRKWRIERKERIHPEIPLERGRNLEFVFRKRPL